MAKSKERQWIEDAAKNFGMHLFKKGNVWQLKHGRDVVYKSNYLFEVQRFLLRRIEEHIDKNTSVTDRRR
jgi:hypothetical protein